MNRAKLFLGMAMVLCLGCATNLIAEEAAATNSTEVLLQHSDFRERLVWIGSVAPTESESASLLKITRHLDDPGWTTKVEWFLRDNPASPWAASLHYAYAAYCHQAGRTTKALEQWQSAWNLVKNDTSFTAVRLASAILGNWTEQLSSLGRSEKLKELIPAGDHLQFANRQDREKFQSAKRNYFLMRKHPEISFRCGTLALKAVGQTLQPTNQALEALVDIPSPTNGFSLSALTRLARQYGLDLAPVTRIQGNDLIVPSVVHWRQNHYAAILQQQGDYFLVNDPTFGKPRWMKADVINEEASGAFLVPAFAQNQNWKVIGSDELASIHGMGLPNNIKDAKDKGCNTVAGGAKQCNCTGMPVSWVSEPYCNLWIADEPISYLTSTGEPFNFRINFKQRGLGSYYEYVNGIPHYFATNANYNFNPWNHSWFSYIALQTTSPTTTGAFPTLANSDVTLFLPGGGEVDFAKGQTYDSETRLLLQQTDPNTSLGTWWGIYGIGGFSPDNGQNGLRIVHADGAQDIYGFGVEPALFGPPYDNVAVFLLSRHIDAHGRTTQYQYLNTNGAANYMLAYVIDPDGLTNTLSYTYLNTNGVAGFVLTQVSNPYGASAHFNYDSDLNLTNLVDAVGNSSSVAYDTYGDPTSMTTPYGTTHFNLYENTTVESTNDAEGNFGGDDLVDRAAVITDPVGGTQLYLYRYDCSQFMPTNYASNVVPTNTPLGTLDTGTGGTNLLTETCYRNSFAWNARQYAALSTTNFAALTTNDFLRGTMKHWLEDTNYLTLTSSLSVQRDPSPDGTTQGLMTFYDYLGKIYPQRAGTNLVPSVTAWRLPGGETHYEYVQYDYFGNVTNRVTTYTTSAAVLGERTNQYKFFDNTYTNVVLAQYTDNTGTNYFFEPVSSSTYTVPNLLTQIVEANGSNAWTFAGFDVVMSTNYFDYGQSNGTISSSLRTVADYATNALGLLTKRIFTNFDLVTSVQWPAGLTTSNIYNTNGFLVQTIDLQIQRTNSYAYSTNGLPSLHTNELGLVTLLFWDNLLRLTGAGYPDSSSISNIYNRLDVVAHKDRIGSWTEYVYDGLDHLNYITNARSAVTTFSWCDCGVLTSITDALLTNTTTLNYDFQSRLTNVVFADSSSLNYQYDLAGRRINTSDGSGKSLSVYYNNQGLVTTLSNLFGTTAQFNFDILDRPFSQTDANNVTVTNGFDMLNRVVNRVWTVDGLGETYVYSTNGLVAYTNRLQQPTVYFRDSAARLTTISNANHEVTKYSYDASSHLIKLVDGLNHTNAWNYNQYGWVTNKVDATNRQSFLYAYDPDGRVTNRWMLGTGNTGYAYDQVGNLTNITYSNTPTTAPISYGYDLDNRLTSMIDAVGTHNFGYTRIGQLASEGGIWTSDTVAYTYNQGHLSTLNLSQPGSTAWSQTYSYDNAWRMTGVSAPSGAFAYGYGTTASRLLSSLSLPNAASVTYQYDPLARMTNTALANYWGQVLDGYGYAYDAVSERKNITRTLGITANNIVAGYDNIGQLTSWTASETNGASRLNEQLGYAYDAADNFTVRTNGALIQTFAVDALNQLTTATRTGAFTETGATPAPVTNLTVNGLPAQRYSDFTFARTNLTLANGNNSFTNIAQNMYGVAATNIVTANLPTNVAFLFDNNGNISSDGTRSFFYDAENQLTNVNVAGQWKTEFVYDGLRRKRISRNYTWQSGAWDKTNEVRYLYDWMLVIQERDTNNNPQVTYTRGLDLSLKRQGAGGIGGLLARTDTNETVFYHSDGNGNVTALMDGNQNIVARYEYDAFGRLVGKWGALADVNVMRFSSMPVHSQSGLVLYPFRAYDPTLQRFIQRDPIQEWGGINLYQPMANSPLNVVDPYGLLGWSDFNPGLLFSGQAWENLPSVLAHGAIDLLNGSDFKTPTPDPDSYLAQRGVDSYHDENGNVIQPGDLFVDKIGVPAVMDVGQAAMMMLGPGEAEGAYAEGDKALKAAREAKAAKACDKFPKIGYKGTKPYRDALKKIGQGGTHVDLGFTPTRDQALQLLEDAGVDIKSPELRIEPPHPAPNPHDYPHINYPTPSGGKGTIRIQ